MPVDNRHDDYRDALDDWNTVRDCLAGERRIKEKSETYLPRPSAQIIDTSKDSAFIQDIKTKAYNAYKLRANFPDLIEPAQRALIGTLFRKPAEIVLPGRIDYLTESATPDGLTLESLARRIASDIIVTGRAVLITDFTEMQRPQLLSYPAEALINWREETINGERKLTLAVIECELKKQREDSDLFEECDYKEWRVLRLSDGIYQQDIWRDDAGNGPEKVEENIVPTARGEPLTEIPLIIVGATDLLPDIDRPPLLGLARTALAIYRNSADYEQALYMTAQPTPVISGQDPTDDNKPTTIGSTVIWYLSDPQAKASYLEFSGEGLAKQREAIEDKYMRAIVQGAAMLEPRRAAPESGKALELRQAAKTATLNTIAECIGESFRKALQWAAVWADTDPKEVIYEPNTDFIEVEISPQLIKEIRESWIAGLVPIEEAWWFLREGEIIRSDDKTMREKMGLPEVE